MMSELAQIKDRLRRLEDMESLRLAYATWQEECYERKEKKIESCVDFYADDAILKWGENRWEGKKEIRERYQQFAKSRERGFAHNIRSTHLRITSIEGDTATAIDFWNVFPDKRDYILCGHDEYKFKKINGAWKITEAKWFSDKELRGPPWKSDPPEALRMPGMSGKAQEE